MSDKIELHEAINALATLIDDILEYGSGGVHETYAKDRVNLALDYVKQENEKNSTL